MKRFSRTFRYSSLNQIHGRWVILVALVCALAFFGCNGDDGAKDTTGGDTTTGSDIPPSTVGALNIIVNPSSANVVVTGPNDFTQTFTGNQLLTNLVPGEYTVTGTAAGFVDAFTEINVVAGYTSSLQLNLQAVPLIIDSPRAVYRDGNGNLIPLDTNNLDAGQVVFYAWLKDVPDGILTTNLTSTVVTDPGKPLLEEQRELATSFTQNLACAWVGYKDSTGVVRPIIGADVRWEIDQWWTGRVNSMQFGASDDYRSADTLGIFDDQADTRTNNGNLETERFPFIQSEYPLYNATGVGTPFVDGLTWVTLFSPDAIADGRIVVVATLNGEEIGKQILYKSFAPTPEIQITKTVNKDVVNLIDGTASVTWTVKISNVGYGDATDVSLKDYLASGAAASYTIGDVPEGSTKIDDGFTYSFPLDAGDSKTLTFTGTVTEAGTYCNFVEILTYSAGSNKWTPVDLNAEACFTALESNVSLIKDFVADDETTSLGKSRTVQANQQVKLRVRVVNNGTGIATGVNVNDVLTSGDATKYEFVSVSSGTPNGTDGFDTNIGNVDAGQTVTMIFTVYATADGKYCDTATVTATSGTIGIGSDSACLNVATPNLSITKTDAPASVLPGGTYTSTIVVSNTGSATAYNVVISDVLGLNSELNVQAIYVSSSLNGMSGSLSGNVVTADSIDIPGGQSVTFIVVSRIPLGAASGTYCDTATFTSDNAGTKEASDCVDVPAYSALQTQLIDLNDPVAVGKNVTYFSVLYVEALSNEGVHKNKLTFSFGLVSPTTLGIPGVFVEISTLVYLDTQPIRDITTGLVISDTSNSTAILQKEGVDYTLETQLGMQVITMSSGVVLQPNTALYVVHVVQVPTGTATNKLYTTSYIWDSVGYVNPSNTYEASSSEPTTVLP